MPAIKIDATELQEVLRLTPAAQNIMLVGKHGIGKSQIVKNFYESESHKVITFFLGQMSDPGDLIGLMHKNQKTGHSEFMPPFWWPTDKKPVVLFLDELNRARPEILQSVMDLTLNRTLAGKSLPAGSRIVSAVNEGEEYQLTDLDPALVSRFNIYQFLPTLEDWLLWANKNNVDQRVIDFLQKNSEYLDGDPRTVEGDSASFGAELTPKPDRRAWHRVSSALDSIQQFQPLHVKVVAGIVGVNAAMAFSKSLKDTHLLSAEDVLLRFGKAKAKIRKMETHQLAALNDRIIMRIEKGKFKAAEKRKALKNFYSYIELLLKEKQSESVAHLASLLERPKFESTAQFLLADADILSVMVEYIGAIAIE